jgi:hypothetical protein
MAFDKKGDLWSLPIRQHITFHPHTVFFGLAAAGDIPAAVRAVLQSAVPVAVAAVPAAIGSDHAAVGAVPVAVSTVLVAVETIPVLWPIKNRLPPNLLYVL